MARRLEVSDQSIRRWVKAGELKAYKPKKEYRIAESDLQEFLEERAVPLAQPPLLDLPKQRRTHDYQAARDTLIEFVEHWEKRLAEARFEQEDLDEFGLAVKGFAPMVHMAIDAEKTDLRARYGSESVLLTRSVLWPAIDRLILLGVEMARAYEEQFGQSATVTNIEDFRRTVGEKAS